MRKQRTIENPASFSGIGLHTGNRTTITFKPAPPDTGIVFIRTDLPDKPRIQADVAHVVDVSRGTTIGVNGARLLTIEHILAAFSGLGINNIFAEVDASEAPVADGSASPFVDVLLEAGLAEQDRPCEEIRLKEPIAYEKDGVTLMALPSDELRLSSTIDYGHPLLGSQFRSMAIDPSVFTQEIAPSRTYCFLQDVELLQAQGLIKGGSLDNAIVIGNDEILNEKLRFKDEFVRHKLLDLLGDLVLLGKPLIAHVIAIKAGHSSHVEFIKQIRAAVGYRQTHKATMSAEEARQGTVLDARQIADILPHRHPFLFVDKITKVSTTRAYGVKNVTISEPYFQGHMPGNPIVPGVLIIEAIAQVGAVLVLEESKHRGKIPVIFGIERAKFRKPVYPGDRMDIAVSVVNMHKRYGKLRGSVSVDGRLAAEADITFGTTSD